MRHRETDRLRTEGVGEGAKAGRGWYLNTPRHPKPRYELRTKGVDDAKM